MFSLVKKSSKNFGLNQSQIKVNGIPVNKESLIYYSSTLKNLIEEFPEEDNLFVNILEDYQEDFKLLLSFLDQDRNKLVFDNLESFFYFINFLELTNVYLDSDKELKEILLKIKELETIKEAKCIVSEFLELFRPVEFFVKKNNTVQMVYIKTKKGEFYKYVSNQNLLPIRIEKEEWEVEQKFVQFDLSKILFDPKGAKLIKQYGQDYYWIDQEDQLRNEKGKMLTATQVNDFFFEDGHLFVVSTDFILYQVINEYFSHLINTYRMENGHKLHVIDSNRYVKLSNNQLYYMVNENEFLLEDAKDFYVDEKYIYTLSKDKFYGISLENPMSITIILKNISLEKISKVNLINKQEIMVLEDDNLKLIRINIPVKRAYWFEDKVWLLTKSGDIQAE